MATPRFFSSSSLKGISQGDHIELPLEEARHAMGPLRMKEGDPAEVFDGQGRTGTGRLTDCSKKAAKILIETIEAIAPLSPYLTIAFAPPKGKRCMSTVEALTELGADELIPLKSSRGVAEGGSRERWQARALEASKQCHRAYLPLIGEDQSVKEVIAKKKGLICIASLAPEAIKAADLKSSFISHDFITWCIGPEGGFTDEEEAELLGGGALQICLAPNILRISTAAELACGLTRFFS